MPNTTNVDVLIIGAGPSGAIAAALLAQQGHSVLVLEKERFPRFSIGESLLPQCMQFIEEANMLDAVQQAGFQLKNGAAFSWNGMHTEFDFRKKFSEGWGTTFQVERARFDHILATEAEKQGVDVRYEHEITAVTIGEQQDPHTVSYLDSSGNSASLQCAFILDASGFGRVLPRLLDLHLPSNFPVRQSLFTHVVDHINHPDFDREKILITIHPQIRDLWYWLIPFGNGKSSIGLVAEPQLLARYEGDDETVLNTIVNEDPHLKNLLSNAEFNHPVRRIVGYSSNVKQLHGNRYALLGNAGEFLDPVFSSGVTIAMKSASLAANLVNRQFSGQSVDWENEFSIPLKKGVDTFRTFVTAWYDQRFQDVIFDTNQQPAVREMICSILAGYAWDEANPYVAQSERRLDVLAKLCKAS